MTAWGEHVSSAFALGFALGAAPGPVQVLILSETARRGFSGGLRVMLGANGTLFAVMVALALGFSSLTPGPRVASSASARGRRLRRVPRRHGGPRSSMVEVAPLEAVSQRRRSRLALRPGLHVGLDRKHLLTKVLGDLLHVVGLRAVLEQCRELRLPDRSGVDEDRDERVVD